MFLINLNYKKPIELVEEHTAAHRKYLAGYFEQKKLLISGPKIPRTGGIIIALMNNRDELQRFIEQDPFFIYDIAQFDIIEFHPGMSHEQLKMLLTETG